MEFGFTIIRYFTKNLNKSKIHKEKSNKKERGASKEADNSNLDEEIPFVKSETSEPMQPDELRETQPSDGGFHSNEGHAESHQKQIEIPNYSQKASDVIPSLITTK